MHFRPCIDLHDGHVKQIVGGTLSDSGATENFISDKDSAYYAELYQKDNLTGGHIIKLGANNDEAALMALKAYPYGMQIGGGITAENAKFWLDNGAEKVILTSYIFSDAKLNIKRLDKIVEIVSKEKLVLDLSCRKKGDQYYIVTDRWQKFTNMEVNAKTLEFLAGYCSEFLIHAVDVEGLQSGVDKELIALMGKFSPIYSVYAGGISSMDDIKLIMEYGNENVGYTVGSALDIFGGKLLKYNEVVEYDKQFSNE
ncbi:phosphoribosylformimino-5-aminoimidazole carboxamide ribotide isomerase [Lentisphaerota bacterium WC36G]|nr:phosphoribosylformimino-5-aminoimidazole carboxamide ribotide isomerase [Lentisphaerae bacterium WC36]